MTRRFHAWLLGILIAFVLATHLMGATATWRTPLWGANMYAFLPPAALIVAVVLLLAGTVIALGARSWFDRLMDRMPVRFGSLPGWVGLAIAATGFFAICWILREDHTLLGDAHPLTRNLPRGQRFHPDEPLTLLVHQWFYQLARPLFASQGSPPAEVARGTVALSSALCGALFIPVLWGIARDIAGSSAGIDQSKGRTPAPVVALLFLVMLAQGYVQLFFGYVENYTFFLLALGCYILAALRHLQGRAPLVLPGAILVLAIALHLAAAMLLPTFAVLVLVALARPGRRLLALRDLAILGGLFAVAHFALAVLHPGYGLGPKLLGIVATTTDPESSFGFSRPAPSAFFNEQILVGPLGLFLFLPALAAALPGVWRDGRSLFMASVGAVFVVASLIAGGTNLGDARNWDLLAPAGLALTMVGLDCGLFASWSVPDLRRGLFVLALLSLFHTVPWVAINASFERSFERFKTLPLGHGRTESTVGFRYLEMGQEEEAIRWFRRSLDANPRNNMAAYWLGVIATRRNDYEFASQAFWSALRVRPGNQVYRLALADALMRSGRPQWAKLELDTLLLQNPREPVYWAGLSMAWSALGVSDSSMAALDRAVELAPRDSRLDSLRAHLGHREGYAKLPGDWTAIVRYGEDE
jgi:Flp pilus assembly protein TadD